MAMSGATKWVNTTHDWAASVDRVHLETIRSDPEAHAPGGLQHLVLEVIAYANDEAEALGRRGECTVNIHMDGSISVADNGRGTDTRRDGNGEVIKKPIMATKDLRFFDSSNRVLLPDGKLRLGMSVVAALSSWLTHTNHRENGAWTQRYEHGFPTTALVPIEPSQSTGTTIRFLVDHHLVSASTITPADIRTVADFPWLAVEVSTE